MNVPNETCLSNTRNYTNINKHYCVSTTVSAATDVLPGGAGVFFAVTSSRSECQYRHASLIAYARYSKVKTATTWDSCDHPRHSLCWNLVVWLSMATCFSGLLDRLQSGGGACPDVLGVGCMSSSITAFSSCPTYSATHIEQYMKYPAYATVGL